MYPWVWVGIYLCKAINQATGGTIKLAFASGRIANLPGLLQIGGEMEVEMGSMSISFNWQ